MSFSIYFALLFWFSFQELPLYAKYNSIYIWLILSFLLFLLCPTCVSLTIFSRCLLLAVLFEILSLKKNIYIYIFIRLFLVLVVVPRFLAVGAWLLSSYSLWAPEHGVSVVVLCGLICPMACGILVPWPGIEPTLPALEGRFLTTGPPGKSPPFLSLFLWLSSWALQVTSTSSCSPPSLSSAPIT